MNKETFLGELRGCLQVLEDQEQEDILAEYAQHIDIKIQKGLSEEEAIRDFGSVKELAAGILEAYHVKPQYREEKGQNLLPGMNRAMVEEGKKRLQKTGSFLKEKWTACVRSIGRGFRWTGRKLRACGAWIGGLFLGKRRLKASEGEGRSERGMAIEEVSAQEQPVVRTRKDSFLPVLGHGIAVCFRTCVNLCLWCLRLFWNLAWLLFSMFCGIMAAILLAGVGGTVVLLFQGYPFLGILLVALGGLLCFGALCCGAFSLTLRRGKKGSAEEGTSEEEEAEESAETRKPGQQEPKEGMDTEKAGDLEIELREEVRHE